MPVRPSSPLLTQPDGSGRFRVEKKCLSDLSLQFATRARTLSSSQLRLFCRPRAINSSMLRSRRACLKHASTDQAHLRQSPACITIASQRHLPLPNPQPPNPKPASLVQLDAHQIWKHALSLTKEAASSQSGSFTRGYSCTGNARRMLPCICSGRCITSGSPATVWSPYAFCTPDRMKLNPPSSSAVCAAAAVAAVGTKRRARGFCDPHTHTRQRHRHSDVWRRPACTTADAPRRGRVKPARCDKTHTSRRSGSCTWLPPTPRGPPRGVLA